MSGGHHTRFFYETWGRARPFDRQKPWSAFRLWLHSLFCRGC